MEQEPKLSPPIYEYTTKNRFLNILDALRIEKVKVEIGAPRSA